jgi:hypothetical protein
MMLPCPGDMRCNQRVRFWWKGMYPRGAWRQSVCVPHLATSGHTYSSKPMTAWSRVGSGQCTLHVVHSMTFPTGHT